jgi:type II secretory pathway pseudopilin PulG
MASLNNKRTQGFLMVDVMIGLFVASVIATAFLSSVVYAVQYSIEHNRKLQAEFLAVEMLEVARELETSDWSTLTACDNPCHPDPSGGVWLLNSGTENIGPFTRSLSIEAVARSAGAIDPAGTNDPNTKKVVATVTWPVRENERELELEIYVYKFFE